MTWLPPIGQPFEVPFTWDGQRRTGKVIWTGDRYDFVVVLPDGREITGHGDTVSEAALAMRDWCNTCLPPVIRGPRISAADIRSRPPQSSPAGP